MNRTDVHSGRWRILGVSYLGIIAFALVFQAFSPVVDLMVSGVGLTHAQAGALMSYFALPGILFSLLSGMLTDRYGARAVGLISLLLMTLGSILTALGNNFIALAAGRAIAGTGAFALTVTLTQLISVWFKGKELGLAMGIYNTGMPLGTIVTLNTLGIVGRMFGWHVSLWSTAFVSLIALAAFFFAVDAPPGAGKDGAGSDGHETMEEGRKRSTILQEIAGMGSLGVGIWLVGLSWLWNNASGISFLTFGTDYFLSQGKGSAAAGLLTSFLMVGSLFLSPVAGYMVDRGWSQKTMIFAGSAGLGIVYLFIPRLPSDAYLLTILLGIGAALIPVAVFSLPARILPLEHVGTGFGIISTCLNVGIMIGPCAVGIARDLVGGYGIGFVMMAFFAFLSMASIVPLKMKNNLNAVADAGDAGRR